VKQATKQDTARKHIKHEIRDDEHEEAEAEEEEEEAKT
jgi:hypothetical protein